jgi:hypothetical protein
MNEPIQLSRSGAVINASTQAIEELQREFAEHHCILLPRLIDPAIHDILLEQVSNAHFVQYANEGIGTETWAPSLISVSTLNFLTNTPAFVRFVGHVTGCSPIGIFSGRIYRISPAEEQHLDWHSDIIPDDPRLITLSLNLSPEPYEGGETQIRETANERIVCKIANTGLGDAILFRVSPALEHRVTPVRGTIPRTAYAGWFRPPIDNTRRDFHSAIRQPQSLDTNAITGDE